MIKPYYLYFINKLLNINHYIINCSYHVFDNKAPGIINPELFEFLIKYGYINFVSNSKRSDHYHVNSGWD